MSRQPRIQFPGAIYHITSRGNRRAHIFLDDHDYLTWHKTFATTAEKFGFISHSFCLMPNHFHILLETMQANLSKGMQFLNSHYSQHFNKRHGKDGHLLQGRFNAQLVEHDSYFAELGRYIALNPVRAGLVECAADWRWSSYRYTAGLATPPHWLETDRILAHFGQRDNDLRHKAFRAFVASGMDCSNPLKGRLKSQKPDATQSQPAPKPLADYACRPNRNSAIADAISSGAYSKKDIAEAFGVSKRTIGRAAKRN
ncbi:REP-associated tyrosine transposase [Pseudoduganella sp. RAF53_2]|uniref:REP-associated tyrosine transposase n=1 Tax=unclassified Pseudoduganella TaxID=2637179 RepID=UPI003F9BBD1C